MIVDSIVIVLALLNVWQFYFWSKITDRLENKLMSRDFHDYVETQRPVIPKTNFKLPIDEIDLNREIQPF